MDKYNQFIEDNAKEDAIEIADNILDSEYYNGKVNMSVKLQMYLDSFREYYESNFEDEDVDIDDAVVKYKTQLTTQLHDKLDKDFILTEETDDNILWMDVTYR